MNEIEIGHKDQHDISFIYNWLTSIPNDEVKEAIHELLLYNESEQARNKIDDCCDKNLEHAQWILAVNTKTPDIVLDHLSKSSFEEIRARVAENPSSSHSAMRRLAYDESPRVRAALAENTNICAELIELLYTDEHPDVRYTLAESHHIPRNVLEKLTNDENPYVAHRAKRTLNNIAIYDKLNKPKEEIKTPSSFTILLAEDDPIVRFVLREKIEATNDLTICAEAETGEIAIEQYAQLKPDIVLMDIGLPGLSGIETTKKLKEKYPDCKIVMVTGRHDEANIMNSLKAGANGYVLKNNEAQELINAIRAVINGEKWIDPGITSTLLRILIKETGSSVNANASMAELDKQSAYDPVMVTLSMAETAVRENDWPKVSAYIQVATKLSESCPANKVEQITGFISHLAESCYAQEKYFSSEFLFLKALELFQQAPQVKATAVDSTLAYLAQLYESANCLEQAEMYYSLCLRIYEENNNQEKAQQIKKHLQHISQNS